MTLFLRFGQPFLGQCGILLETILSVGVRSSEIVLSQVVSPLRSFSHPTGTFGRVFLAIPFQQYCSKICLRLKMAL